MFAKICRAIRTCQQAEKQPATPAAFSAGRDGAAGGREARFTARVRVPTCQPLEAQLGHTLESTKERRALGSWLLFSIVLHMSSGVQNTGDLPSHPLIPPSSYPSEGGRGYCAHFKDGEREFTHSQPELGSGSGVTSLT